MPELLTRVLAQASGAKTPEQALELLLTLDGHVSADVSRHALAGAEVAALAARFERPDRASGPVVYTGWLGLSHTGKTVIGTPDDEPAHRPGLAGTAAVAVPWTAQDVHAFEETALLEHRRATTERAACRDWIAGRSPDELAQLMVRLRSILLHTAPFVLYREHVVYTNFREEQNLTGKSLFPGHPRCVLHGLERLAPQEWTDDQVVLVACILLLADSGGNHRVEECNGTQLNLRRVAQILEEIDRRYAEITDVPCAPTPESDPAALAGFAKRLAATRQTLLRTHVFYRRIAAPLINKQERITRRPTGVSAREAGIMARLSEALPLTAGSCVEAVAQVRAESEWLVEPHGRFATGLEDLIYQTVAASTHAFAAHFALSRGFRALPALIAALRAEDWARICAWELPDFFCCVVPSSDTVRLFGSAAAVADAAWAMSARMQFNSWHFLAGNLPQVPAVQARDYFDPPAMPDISDFSDQHHRGHVFNRVRFTIRSPRPVTVDGLRFAGLTDLRLVRCTGDPFQEDDLLDAEQISRLLAAAFQCVADQAADGRHVEVTAFDHVWHRDWAG